MACWDSPVLGDDSKARVMRNRSLTKEEVEAFRRQRAKPPAKDDGGGDVVVTSPLASPGRPLEKSVPSGGSQMRDAADGANGESPSKSRDWWTRSNWAFLNEPPQEEAPGKAHSYTPQFHVATGHA